MGAHGDWSRPPLILQYFDKGNRPQPKLDPQKKTMDDHDARSCAPVPNIIYISVGWKRNKQKSQLKQFMADFRNVPNNYPYIFVLTANGIYQFKSDSSLSSLHLNKNLFISPRGFIHCIRYECIINKMRLNFMIGT